MSASFSQPGSVQSCGAKQRDAKQRDAKQRGATLTGYAMTVALMVVMSLGSMKALEDNGETFLEETGEDIGSPRDSAEQLAADQLAYLSTSGNSLGSRAAADAAAAAQAAAQAAADAAAAQAAADTYAAQAAAQAAADAAAAAQAAADQAAAEAAADAANAQAAAAAAAAQSDADDAQDSANAAAASAAATSSSGNTYTQPVAGKTGQVATASHGLCLQQQGGTVTQQTCTGGSDQGFSVVASSATSFVKIQTASGLCVTQDSTSTADSRLVSLESCTDGNAFQNWIDLGNGQYADANDPTRCLDVKGNNADPGNKLSTWRDCKTGSVTNQHFGFATPASTYTPVTNVSQPFSPSGSNIQSQTSGPITFSADGAGTYEVKLTGVNAPDGGSNSFFVSINGGAQMPWHLPAGGSGTFGLYSDFGNQYSPLFVTLGDEEDIVIEVFGREGGTVMGGAQIVKQ